jgi:hypothetical protein
MLAEADGAFRTTDMALAAVLASQGFAFRLERLSSTQGAWVFQRDGESDELDDIIGTYEDRGCKVEPRAYLEEVARVRNALYSFMGTRRASSAQRVSL